MIVDEATGAVAESGVELVPLDLAAMNEAELLELCAGALLKARRMIAQAPAVLAARSKAVKDAKRNLIVARGYARQRAVGRDAETRKLVAESDADVVQAWEAIDVAELALEYAREMRKTLSEDIEILRSLNANFRGEHQ